MIQMCRVLLVSIVLVSVTLAASNVGAQSWQPPDAPDPQEIRREADSDIEEGRLGLAAKKYLWYHENALKYQPSLGGVRLSFALSDWRELAKKYPPALRDMSFVRDRAEETVRLNDRDFSAFQDFASLNRALNEDFRTIELFKWFDQNNRHFARDIFVLTQGVLTAAGEYELSEKYVVGRNSFDSVIEDHQQTVARFKEHFKDDTDYDMYEADMLETHDMIFARKASFIIAILVNRGRESEAKDMADRALQLLEDEVHQLQISDALEGIPPERLM